MTEASEKSTDPARASVHPDVVLDARLAIFHQRSRWLALADVHYGYEVARRAEGGLWPLWGMGAIEERLAGLLDDYAPETVILVGDVIDRGVVDREALAWLAGVRERCAALVLVAGNHDAGAIRREASFVETHETGDGFFFHHGHEGPSVPESCAVEVCGHWHPGVHLSDGAGLRLRLPCLVQEQSPDEPFARWVLPAFSPWAGNGKWAPRPGAARRQWVCGKNRVFELEPTDQI
ncbi:MAG: metallophosphoesterase [Akkermansiaceae bacterium]|nr:metallophosphoesterase [Akkermansiaceae bacterium]